MNFGAMIKVAEKLAIDNSPAILTALGVTGTIATAVLTGKASLKAYELTDNLESITGVNSNPRERFKERFANVWTLYIPPLVTGTITIVAIIGANHINGRRAAAMATAYSLSERAFSEYKEKVVHKIGEKKEREYRDEIAQDRVSANPPKEGQIIISGNGQVLCYDHFTGRYFESDMESLRKAENEINHMILTQGYASVSDLYDILGLKVTSFSDEVGWNQDKLLAIEYSTVMSPDNRPCISIDFDLSPHRKYSHFAGE